MNRANRAGRIAGTSDGQRADRQQQCDGRHARNRGFTEGGEGTRQWTKGRVRCNPCADAGQSVSLTRRGYGMPPHLGGNQLMASRGSGPGAIPGSHAMRFEA